MELQINGKTYSTQSSGSESLLEVLRDEFDLTGSKYGCGEGVCGACTVLVDGVPTRSCLARIESLAGKQITTIEGLAENGETHRVQESFLKVDVFQCGYCAPGMVMSTVALLEKNPRPTRAQVVSAMQGNICRCGTYPRILEAIDAVANV
jgi:aerobic-type carbon monoxide dehydrogenase small subunit (CoxS/CutS family)